MGLTVAFPYTHMSCFHHVTYLFMQDKIHILVKAKIKQCSVENMQLRVTVLKFLNMKEKEIILPK